MLRRFMSTSGLATMLLVSVGCARPSASPSPPAPLPPEAQAEAPEPPEATEPSVDPGRMDAPRVVIPRDTAPLIKPTIDSARLDRPDVLIPRDGTPPFPAPPSVIDSARLGEPLRRPPPPKAEAPVRMSFVGDISPGTITLPGGVPPDSGRGLLARVTGLLEGDLVVGNFESTVGDTGTPSKCRQRDGSIRQNCYAFVSPTHLLQRLREAGFTHLNLANNHANDLGPVGREQAERAFEALGIRTYGPLERISIDTLYRGDSITVVGLVGFTTYPHSYNLLDIAESEAVIGSVRPVVDVLIATFHGGGEGAEAVRTPRGMEFLGREPRGDLRRWARAVIDAGADAVIGHGPHVLRGIEFYLGRPIVYSLGNFATYRGFNLTGPLGVTAVLHLELGPEGAFRAARLHPLIQRPRMGPEPDPEAKGIKLMQRLSREDFGESGAVVTDAGEILPPRAEVPAP